MVDFLPEALRASILFNIFLLVAGLYLLKTGAGKLVSAAVRLSLRASVPPALIGVTIVAFGTSAPELVTAISAALKGGDGVSLAVGTIIGSNIANIALILGVCGLIRPMYPDAGVLKWDGPWVVLAALALTVFIFMFNAPAVAATGSEPAVAEGARALLRWEGLAMLGIFVAFLVVMFIRSRKGDGEPSDEVKAEMERLLESKWTRDLLVFVFGLLLLLAGADALVSGAQTLAVMASIPPVIVGLTVVAIGTSVPELATSIAAARIGQGELAISNVTGSNIQNILLCMAASAVVLPAGVMVVSGESIARDLIVMWVFTLLLLGFLLFGRKIDRLRGALLLVLYAGFVAMLAMDALQPATAS